MIRYVDSSGWTWEVCELAPGTSAAPPADGARAVEAVPLADRPPRTAHDAVDHENEIGALYFFSRLGTRKLREYPPAWSELARADLEALCEVAREVGAGAMLTDRAPG